MSYNEYLLWAEFRNRRGSLFTGRRVEQAVGQLSYLTAIAAGAKGVRYSSFAPHEAEEASEDTDAMEAFKKFAGVA